MKNNSESGKLLTIVDLSEIWDLGKVYEDLK